MISSIVCRNEPFNLDAFILAVCKHMNENQTRKNEVQLKHCGPPVVTGMCGRNMKKEAVKP